MDMRGHNSASFGEALGHVETILPDDHETMFRYAQWHIGDYITGTMGMQLEQEGAYMRFLVRLYQRGKPLPDDDRYMATCMNLSVRVWRRVRDGLIAVGKIIAKCGCLTNSRFERERQIRAATIRKQAEAARLRWERERSEKMGLTEVSAKFAGSLDETSPKLSEFAAKKASKINTPVITDLMLTINQYPLEEKERDIAQLPLSAPARKKSVLVPESYSDDFEAFWKIYPRKVGKAAASKSWERLLLEQKRRAYSALKSQLSILTTQASDTRGNFCPHPATWINEGRFDDELGGASSRMKPEGMPDIVWQQIQAAEAQKC